MCCMSPSAVMTPAAESMAALEAVLDPPSDFAHAATNDETPSAVAVMATVNFLKRALCMFTRRLREMVPLAE